MDTGGAPHEVSAGARPPGMPALYRDPPASGPAARPSRIRPARQVKDHTLPSLRAQAAESRALLGAHLRLYQVPTRARARTHARAHARPGAGSGGA